MLTSFVSRFPNDLDPTYRCFPLCVLLATFASCLGGSAGQAFALVRNLADGETTEMHS